MIVNRTNSFLKDTECSNHVFPLENLKTYQGGENLTQKQLRGPTTCKDMLQTCVERYCKLANKKAEQLNTVSNLG